MDEPRKSTFLFNTEWGEVLMDFGAEVKLEVYEAIIRYAASGTVGELKPQAKMAFAFIKREMDFNARQYQQAVEKRREAGQKGGKAKQSQANASNAKQCQAMPSNAKQSQANASIYEYDNDNIYSAPTSQNIACAGSGGDAQGGFKADGEFLACYMAKTSAVEAFCINNRVTVEEFRAIAAEVLNEWELAGKVHNSPTDAASHLTNQSRIKINAKRKPNGTNNYTGGGADRNLAECGEAIAAKLATPNGGDDFDLSGDY